MSLKITNVVGARPNFMKIAPLMAEFKKHPQIEATLIHTGQHYDEKMSGLFFDDLGIPKPDVYLGVGSHNHGAAATRSAVYLEVTELALGGYDSITVKVQESDDNGSSDAWADIATFTNITAESFA